MNTQRQVILRVLLRLMILVTVFFLAAGVGATMVTVYERGLPFTGGASPQQLEAPPARGDSEQADGATTSEPSEAEDTASAASADSETSGDHPIGVWYNASEQRWLIFNQDLAGMPEETTFDVHILYEGESAFVHYATAENISGDSTYVDSLLINGNPDAAPQFTQNWNPGGVARGVYNEHSVDIRYDEEAGVWAIFNKDGADMPEGAAFNVGVFPPREPDLIHTTTAENTSQNWTRLDNPQIDGDPTPLLFVTQE